MGKFQPKITSARFVVSPFSPQQMQELGDVFVASQDARLGAGLNVYDLPAMPLKRRANGKAGYPEGKVRKGLKAIRDWFYTGRTRRSIKVLSANENQVVIGATDAVVDQRIAFNNARERQFGMSPNDREAVTAHVRNMKVITVKTSAA